MNSHSFPNTSIFIFWRLKLVCVLGSFMKTSLAATVISSLATFVRLWVYMYKWSVVKQSWSWFGKSSQIHCKWRVFKDRYYGSSNEKFTMPNRYKYIYEDAGNAYSMQKIAYHEFHVNVLPRSVVINSWNSSLFSLNSIFDP